MIQVVFQNKNIIVCNKPAQVLSVPAREKNDPRPCLGLELQKKLERPVYPVHRLDYEVCGLIMYALDKASHIKAQSWFEKKQIQKIYEALTPYQNFSHWPDNVKTDKSVIELKQGAEFFWKTKILRGKKRSFESDQGEWAETKAVVVRLNEKTILWQLYPITGKPHQLRLELSRHGFPIIGDKLYGSELQHTDNGIALKSVILDLSKISDRLGLPQEIRL